MAFCGSGSEHTPSTTGSWVDCLVSRVSAPWFGGKPLTGPNPSFGEFERAGWENAGVVAGYDALLSGVTAQSIDALLDAANVRAGMRVLDVATGAGYVAGAAAQRGADTTGIDFSAAQVALARSRFPDVRFEQADAQALPFERDTFDAVVNAFGLCHLSGPERALREAFRVLKSGGRIAFTVWDAPERTVGFGAFYAAVRAHGSLDVGLPEGPGFFELSDPQRSLDALRGAGFASPSCRTVPRVWRVSDPDEVFETIAQATVRAAAMLRAQSAPAREAIRGALRNTIATYRRGECFEVPMPALLASAVKP
jgi:SAM-dependent methyltransferase